MIFVKLLFDVFPFLFNKSLYPEEKKKVFLKGFKKYAFGECGNGTCSRGPKKWVCSDMTLFRPGPSYGSNFSFRTYIFNGRKIYEEFFRVSIRNICIKKIIVLLKCILFETVYSYFQNTPFFKNMENFPTNLLLF